MPRIAILGSTGSIGTSALDVARTHADRVEVVAIAAATNVSAMVKQVIEFRPRAVAMATGEAMDKLRAALGGVARRQRHDRRPVARRLLRQQRRVVARRERGPA